MASKLWEKNTEVNQEIEKFTVGRDRELDLYLARYDVLGSMAHITMLESIGLLGKDEQPVLLEELRRIHADIEAGRFIIEEGVEDVHSQVELLLTRKLGDVGKKIHSGRSRNDQVLVDLKLFTRAQLQDIAEEVRVLFEELQAQSERYKGVLMPGYTHLQVAMPSSFGLWFGAYAESLVDDLLFLQAAYKMTNRNPLGSAAGYGSSFPLNRTLTTELLGFDSMNYNVVYAQMGRGKMERNVAFALAGIAGTLSKLAFDACLFNSQNFGFVKLPDNCTTGSSIMPHKKNPISAENMTGLSRLIRTNALAALENQALWHERDISHSSVERVIMPDSTILTDYVLHRLCRLLEGLRIMPENMARNLECSFGLYFSQRVLTALIETGIPRQEAYVMVQRNAMKVWEDIQNAVDGPTYRERLEADDEAMALLSQEKLDEIFDPWDFLTRKDVVFDRLQELEF